MKKFNWFKPPIIIISIVIWNGVRWCWIFFMGQNGCKFLVKPLHINITEETDQVLPVRQKRSLLIFLFNGSIPDIMLLINSSFIGSFAGPSGGARRRFIIILSVLMTVVTMASSSSCLLVVVITSNERREEDKGVFAVAVASVKQVPELPSLGIRSSWMALLAGPPRGLRFLRRLGRPHAVGPRRQVIKIVGFRWWARTRNRGFTLFAHQLSQRQPIATSPGCRRRRRRWWSGGSRRRSSVVVLIIII